MGTGEGLKAPSQGRCQCLPGSDICGPCSLVPGITVQPPPLLTRCVSRGGPPKLSQPAPGHTPSATSRPCTALWPVKRSGLKIPTSCRTEPRFLPRPGLLTGITSLLVCVCGSLSNTPLRGWPACLRCWGLSRLSPENPSSWEAPGSPPSGPVAGHSREPTPATRRTRLRVWGARWRPG